MLCVHGFRNSRTILIKWREKVGGPMVQKLLLKAKGLEQKYIQLFASSCFNNLK
jgi:hypothetical protein